MSRHFRFTRPSSEDRHFRNVSTPKSPSSWETAIDHEGGCGYIRGFVGSEPKHGIGKFLRIGPTLQDAGRNQFVHFGAAKPFDVEWRPRKARADCIHAHPVFAFLESESAGQREHSGFGCVVSAHTFPAVDGV